jgi:hypothetical protein
LAFQPTGTLKDFVIKATGTGTVPIACTYHLNAEDKEAAEKEFRKLMPNFNINESKKVKQEETSDGYN